MAPPGLEPGIPKETDFKSDRTDRDDIRESPKSYGETRERARWSTKVRTLVRVLVQWSTTVMPWRARLNEHWRPGLGRGAGARGSVRVITLDARPESGTHAVPARGKPKKGSTRRDTPSGDCVSAS